MQSKNETVAEIDEEMRHGNNRLAMQQVVMREYADRVDAAHRREVAELEHKAREANLKYLAEKARHTDTYKDARVNAQDKEIAALKREVEELNKKHSDELQVIAAQCNSLQDEVLKLRECLKEAIDNNCEGCSYKKTPNGCDDCSAYKWRKALERASAEDQQLPN